MTLGIVLIVAFVIAIVGCLPAVADVIRLRRLAEKRPSNVSARAWAVYHASTRGER